MVSCLQKQHAIYNNMCGAAAAQVAAGAAAVVHDLSTGRILRRYLSCARAALHSPRVEGTRDGRLLFCGNAEGAVQAYDLRCAPMLCRLSGDGVRHLLGSDAGVLPSRWAPAYQQLRADC